MCPHLLFTQVLASEGMFEPDANFLASNGLEVGSREDRIDDLSVVLLVFVAHCHGGPAFSF